MLEMPEAYIIASQIKDVLIGKTIKRVIVAATPHKLAWFHGDRQAYPAMLAGEAITGARSFGGWVQIELGRTILLFNDGVNLRFWKAGDKVPNKHQLLLEFSDGSTLTAAVQMYGGIICCREGQFDNRYYAAARSLPSPLSTDFDQAYFEKMLNQDQVQKMSMKAFLATEQRIPGLGNGVLQDILYNAHIHPKKKVRELGLDERQDLFHSVQGTLFIMVMEGGRDTEKDLFGRHGSYQTRLSKNTAGKECSCCHGTIHKENFLGGSIYYCEGCQVL